MENVNPNGFDKTLTNNLLQILIEEVSAYGYLHQMLNQKQQYILFNDTEELKKLAPVENIVSTKAVALTRARKQQIKRVFSASGLKKSDQTMDVLIGQMDPAEARQWNRLRSRLRELFEKSMRIHKQNKILQQKVFDVNVELEQGRSYEQRESSYL